VASLVEAVALSDDVDGKPLLRCTHWFIGFVEFEAQPSELSLRRTHARAEWHRIRGRCSHIRHSSSQAPSTSPANRMAPRFGRAGGRLAKKQTNS